MWQAIKLFFSQLEGTAKRICLLHSAKWHKSSPAYHKTRQFHRVSGFFAHHVPQEDIPLSARLTYRLPQLRPYFPSAPHTKPKLDFHSTIFSLQFFFCTNFNHKPQNFYQTVPISALTSGYHCVYNFLAFFSQNIYSTSLRCSTFPFLQYAWYNITDGVKIEFWLFHFSPVRIWCFIFHSLLRIWCFIPSPIDIIGSPISSVAKIGLSLSPAVRIWWLLFNYLHKWMFNFNPIARIEFSFGKQFFIKFSHIATILCFIFPYLQNFGVAYHQQFLNQNSFSAIARIWCFISRLLPKLSFHFLIYHCQ